MKEAGFDVGKDRVAAVGERTPQSEAAAAQLVGEVGNHRQLDPAKIPGEDVLRTEQRFVKEKDHVGKERQINRHGGAFHEGIEPGQRSIVS